jgi:pimeloyl-ACP methyl ester carboxylesterase
MTKTPVILVHGLRGDHHGLQEIAESLEEKGYKLFTPDLPGYGEEVALEDQSLRGYANWLKSYIESLNLKQPPVVIGHSMGSIVTSHFLRIYPNIADPRTIFLSPIIRTPKGQKRSNFSVAAICGFLQLLSGHARYRFMRSKFVSLIVSRTLSYDHRRQKYIDHMHFEYCGQFTSTISLMNDIRLSMHEQTVLPEKAKTLTLMGDHDRLTKVRNVEARIAGCKNAELHVIQKKGHLINYECPQKVAKIIDEFLQANA